MRMVLSDADAAGHASNLTQHNLGVPCGHVTERARESPQRSLDLSVRMDESSTKNEEYSTSDTTANPRFGCRLSLSERLRSCFEVIVVYSTGAQGPKESF